MKKTYITPTMEIQDFGVQQILAISFDGDGGGGSLGDESADDGAEAMSLDNFVLINI